MDLSAVKSSKSFCVLPWIHLNVMPDSSVIPCCISPYDNVFADGRKSTLEEVWNSKKFREMRLKILSGETLPGCARCYTLEETGFKSMRQEMNTFFSKYTDRIKDTLEDGSVEDLQLKYIDFRFSNLCNFKCRGCGPALSSAWYDDHQSLFGYNSAGDKVKSIAAGAPQFWEELKGQIPSADVIYFGGGEPLIAKEHYEVLKILEEKSLFHISLRYNTNLSILSYQNFDLTALWSRFKEVAISISIDDIGKRAEYFRHGTNWKKIEENISTLKERNPQIDLYINCTVSIMNVYYLPEIFDYLMLNNFVLPDRFRINLLLDPIELRCDVLPPHGKKFVTNKLTKFIFKLDGMGSAYKYAISEIRNVLNFLNKEDNSHLLQQFKDNCYKLDLMRSECFESTYPEMVKLISSET